MTSMGRRSWIWIALPVLTAGLCLAAYQAGGEAARTGAAAQVDKLRAEQEALRKQHDAAVEGLAHAEQQLRLSQQAYAELSSALDVSHEQMKQMRAELDTIRQAVETDAKPKTNRAR